MLNRRQLRIKALQSVYAHFQSESDNLQWTENQLISNLNRLYDLYIYQLSLLTAIHRFAEESLEQSKNKYIPTEEDLNPNTRFIRNKFIEQLNANKDFKRKEEALKINWSGAQEIIRKIVHNFRESKDYATYMKRDKCTYEMDKDIVLMLIRNHLIKNDVLRSYFEEINSMWSEDFYMALALVNLTIHNYYENHNEFTALPPLFKGSEEGQLSEDLLFLKDLVRHTILKKDEYDKIVAEKATNWEFDRIATMDLILMRMGMAEIFEFPTIPLKVTLNEVIELAKHFSSPRSSTFINGLLDRTIADGLKNKTIVKTGRGLVGQ
jgi:N utilization substance protein B